MRFVCHHGGIFYTYLYFLCIYKKRKMNIRHFKLWTFKILLPPPKSLAPWSIFTCMILWQNSKYINFTAVTNFGKSIKSHYSTWRKHCWGPLSPTKSLLILLHSLYFTYTHLKHILDLEENIANNFHIM